MEFITTDRCGEAGYPLLAGTPELVLCDCHTHSRFSDGRASAEEMVEGAIARGMKRLGLSDHSYTAWDESYCMKETDYARYQAEVRALKEKYRGQIELFCGIEQDYDSELKTEGFDYVIGSVHYLWADGEWFPTDNSGSYLVRAAERFYGGDIYALCEAYYEKIGGIAERTGCDIVGHFDVITKHNAGGCLFDEQNERYVAAWQRAVDRILRAGAIIEVNAKGRIYPKAGPYPSPDIVRYIMAHGGRMLIDSDAHEPKWIGEGFETIAE